jgi:hypothetical protein
MLTINIENKKRRFNRKLKAQICLIL